MKKGGYSSSDSEHPFHLHLQNGHRSSVALTRSRLQAHVSELSGPSSVIDGNQNQTTPKSEGCEQQRKASVTSRKLQQVRNDRVTSNKITLGRSPKTHGSYLKTHALKQDVLLKVCMNFKTVQHTVSTYAAVMAEFHG